MSTCSLQQNLGEKLIDILRSIRDDGLMSNKEIQAALGFPNAGQVSQMLEKGVVPNGERVLALLNAELPVQARRRVLALVTGVIDNGPSEERELVGFGVGNAERLNGAILAALQELMDLLPWVSSLRSEEVRGGIDGRRFCVIWPSKVEKLRKVRALLDGLGVVGDELMIGSTRRKAKTPGGDVSGGGLRLAGGDQ